MMVLTSILQISSPGTSPAPSKFSSTNVPGIVVAVVDVIKCQILELQ